MISTIFEPECQVVKMVALFDIGRDIEPKRALCQAMASMLKKTSKNKSFLELNKAINFYGATIEIFATPLYIQSEIYCIKNNFLPLLKLWGETLFEATFQEEDWELTRNQLISQILQYQKQADITADKILSESLLSNLPYLGYYSTEADYKAISLLDIQDFYTKTLAKMRPKIFLAGDIDPSLELEINNLLSPYHLVSNLRNLSLNISSPIVADIHYKLEGTIQSSVRMGLTKVHNTLLDYIHLDFFTFALGGYYTSELMMLLRQKKGYTYGAYSYISHYRHLAMIQISYDIDTSNVAASFHEIKALFSRLNTKRLSIDSIYKQYYSQWLRNSNGSLKEIMYEILFFKMGYNYSDFKQILQEGTTPDFLESEYPDFYSLDFFQKVVVSG